MFRHVGKWPILISLMMSTDYGKCCRSKTRNEVKDYKKKKSASAGPK